MADMTKQSFKFGVDQLYLASITSDVDGAIVYDTPFLVPGTQEIAVTLNNSIKNIYADDGVYEHFLEQGDIDILVSLSGLTGAVRAAILGSTVDATSGLVTMGKDDVPPDYALGYRRQKVNGEHRYLWFYKGSFAAPDSTATTKSASSTEQPMQYKYKAANRLSDGNIKQSQDSDDPLAPVGLTDALLNSAVTGWWTSPDYVPVAPGTAVADVAGVPGASSGFIALSFTAAAGATSIIAQVKDALLPSEWVTVDTTDTITAVSVAAVIEGLTPANTYSVRLVVTGGTNNGVSNEDTGVVALA